jgi:tetratricopeptide (TPR) repeat protein
MPSIEQLQKLLAADPNDPFLLYGMAQEHAKQGRHAEALAWYDRCLAADPKYAYAYFHKARSEEAMGNSDAAVATLRAGQAAARAAGDSHALSEISGYLDELTP